MTRTADQTASTNKYFRPDLGSHFRAVERVEKLLRRVTRILEHAKIAYAVIGGHAVAAWISTVDEDATRATRDVDILVRRADLPEIIRVLAPLELQRIDVLGVVMFVEREHPRPKSGLHLAFTKELIRPNDAHASPDVEDSVEAPQGFRVVPDLPALVSMKLQAYRFIDRAHIVDLASVGLIDESFADKVPEDLRPRLMEVLEEGRKQGLGIHGRPPAT